MDLNTCTINDELDGWIIEMLRVFYRLFVMFG